MADMSGKIVAITGASSGIGDPDDWRTMVDVNLLGLLYCTHAALPIMREQGSGDIVNISSTAGRIARAVSRAPHVSINEILIRPTGQAR